MNASCLLTVRQEVLPELSVVTLKEDLISLITNTMSSSKTDLLPGSKSNTSSKWPVPKRRPKPPSLWKGPEIDGVTQSLIGRFLGCRERFRLYVVEGIREKEAFNEKLEYGNIWHACEENFAAKKDWRIALREYAHKLQIKHPESRRQIVRWAEILRVQFPLYVDHWRMHPDVQTRVPISQEQVFRVPYTLPSGRIVTLRGKFDGLDEIGQLKNSGTYIQENKAKGSVNEEQLKQELHYNIQTNTYLIAAREMFRLKMPPFDKHRKAISGVRYNVIRRPLGDWQGKFNIKQRKGRMTKKGRIGEESEKEFYARLGKLIKDNSEHFFMRWKIEVLRSDTQKFIEDTFVPIMEQLWDWWEWVERGCPKGDPVHFRMPYGVYNPLLEGRPGAYAKMLNKGDMSDVQRVTTIFPELE